MRTFTAIKPSRFHLWKFLSAVVISAAAAGCSRPVFETSYYLIDYRVNPARSALKVAEPLPYKVQVMTFKIPRAYESIRIIARYSSHQINYFRYSLWAVRPQMAIADLLVQQINAYPLFVKCQREFLDERPDFEIGGVIEQIEMYKSEQYTAAHLKMSFEISNNNTGEILTKHDFDREVPIPSDNITIFSKAISDIMKEEAEQFLMDVVRKLQTPPDSLKNAPMEESKR